MLWVTWRQHRIEILGMLLVAVTLAVATVLLAGYVQRVRTELGVDLCPAVSGFSSPSATCNQAGLELASRTGLARYFVYLFFLMPALIGSFVGGPLFAREFERHTHGLGWTQGISRLRWAATILAVALASTVAGAIVVALVGEQTRILSGNTGSRPWDTFDVTGPAFVSFAVFGLAVAAFIGAWRRRILAGMLFGLIAFALVRGAILVDARPYYEPPLVAVWQPVLPISGPSPSGTNFGPVNQIPADAWFVRVDAVDGQGRPVSQERVRALLDNYSFAGCSGSGVRNCDSVRFLNERDVYQRTLYQPADRYWRFQITEAAIYLGLTAALLALTLVLIRRRDA
jgi:hypothetical protein